MTVSNILKEASQFRTLERAVQWGLARRPPAEILDIVSQDEFTLDIVFRVAEDCYLVFDTN
jgi:hypothetical protein